jgi:hypothetical protein
MLNPDFRDILSAFAEHGVDYMVVGAYALAYHGLPRATGDIDLWVQCSRDNAERVWAGLLAFGAPLGGLSIDDLCNVGTVVQIGVAPRRIDVLTAIDGVAYAEAAGDKEIAEIEGLQVPIIGKKHLIENKRAAGRPKDLADLAWLERADD